MGHFRIVTEKPIQYSVKKTGAVNWYMHFRTFLAYQPIARIACFYFVFFASKTAVSESFDKFHVWGLSAVFSRRCQFPLVLFILDAVENFYFV